MKVKEIMEKYPATVAMTSNVQEIATLMAKYRNPALPVVDDEQQLIGIVSECDLLYKKVRPHVPHYVNVLGANIYYGGIGEYNENFHKLLATEARELMTTEVITCTEDMDVEEAASVMIEKHLKVLPVVKNKRLVGTLSRHDIITLIAKGE